jgi:hypothetical protein
MKQTMEIQLVGKLNHRFQVTSPLGTITRTVEDFEILEENLLLHPSSLLVPRRVRDDFPAWFRLLFAYNADPLSNPMITNFLTNERYYLTGRQGKIIKSVLHYMEKVDSLWTQNVTYHKSANQRGQLRRCQD